MGFARLASDEHPGRLLDVRVLTTWAERLRGLLGTSADEGAVLLARCPSIHTFGMRYPIDVALLGELGEVLVSRRGLLPREFLSHPDACCAIERPAAEGEWPERGEHLWVVAVGPEMIGR